MTTINDMLDSLRADIRADIGATKDARELTRTLNFAESAVAAFRAQIADRLDDWRDSYLLSDDISFDKYMDGKAYLEDMLSVRLAELTDLTNLPTWGSRPSYASPDVWSWDQDGSVYYDGAGRWVYVTK